MSSDGAAEVGALPAVATARRPVRKEALVIVGGTPRRNADRLDAQRPRLTDQQPAQIHAYRSRRRRPGERARDFRTYFIAATANTYTTVHYKFC